MQEQEAEYAREVERMRLEADAAAARQIAAVEAQVAEQIARARQEMEAERQQRETERADAERCARKAGERAGSGHLTSWQQADVERQLRLARQAAEAELAREQPSES